MTDGWIEFPVSCEAFELDLQERLEQGLERLLAVEREGAPPL
jgi:hypothetical protein